MTEEERIMVKRVHDFLFAPPVEGKPSRAQQFDEILSAVRAGKMGTRILFWIAGVIAAIGAIVAGMRGWTK